MAKSDAEISLKVNMPPPSDFQKMLERVNKIISDNQKQLAEFRKSVADVAEGARILDERARATGSTEMVKAARGVFNEGWKTASTLDVREAAISKGLSGMESRVAKVQAAKDAGKITDEEAVALLAKYTEELSKASEAVGELGYALEVTKGDLFSAAELDDMLGKFDAFKLTMQDTGGAARAFAAEMRAQADAFAEEREELEMSAPGYEQAAMRLMKLEKEYRGLASAAEAVNATLDANQQKVSEALNAYDGSAEAQKAVYEAIEAGSKKAIEADSKLQGIAEQRALNEQKRAADAEKAAQKEAEAARKRAEAEAERAKKEEAARQLREQKEAEAAAKREAREAEMAKRDEERFEREQFQMKISALSKQELIKVLDDLRKAREAASKADDAETYAKRTREFNMAREQMERTNAALNVQKMMFMQQATAVKSMGNTIEELSTKLENMGEDAEEGELDLVGMAEGTMELASQFQAGLGPVGWFMMGLQALQTVLNKTAEAEKRLAEDTKKTTEDLAAVAEANEDVSRAIQTAVEQENLESRLETLRTKYNDINTALDMRVQLLQDLQEDANHERDRMAAEEEHQRNLLRMEMERALLRGEITREDYDNKLQSFRFEADVNAAQRDAERKRAAAEAAAEEAKAAAEAAETAKKDADAQRETRGKFTVEAEAVDALVRAEETAKNKLDEVVAASSAHNKQRPGFSLNPATVAERYFIDGMIDAFGGDVKESGISDVAEWMRTKERLSERNKKLTKAYFEAKSNKKQMLNGLTAEEYLKQLKEVEEMLKIMEQAEAELLKRSEEAAERAKAAEEEAARAEEYARDVARRSEETRASLAETEATKKAVDAEVKRLEDKLGELRNKVDEMTDEEIETMLKRSNEKARKYGENTPKGSYYRRRAETLRDERAQRRRNNKAPEYIEWLQGEGYRAFSDRSAKGNEKEVSRLLDIYEKAKKTGTRQDDELAKALIMLINLETVKNKKQREKLKAIQNKHLNR